MTTSRRRRVTGLVAPVAAVVVVVVIASVLGAAVATRRVAGNATRARRHATTAVRLVPGVLVVPMATGGSPPTTASCRAASHGAVACYQPFQVRDAYDLGALYAKGVEGQGETIVVVDAFGSPTIRADLARFDRAFSLPAPPAFRVLAPVGPIPRYAVRGKDRYSWAVETSLDVEWAHALAPRADLDLVETPTDEVEGTSGFPDIVAAEHDVLDHHLGDVISQSFGATERTFASASQVDALRSAFVAAAADHVTVLAASGDLGATDLEDDATSIYPTRATNWPATDPLVTAVGGTKLDLRANGSAIRPAVAWNDTDERGSSPYPRATGGGRSIFFARPAYQRAVASVTGPHRGVPDVAMSAACTGLVDVYVGVAGPSSAPGWQPACGTSEATPLFAAVVALADEEAGHPLGLLNPALYALKDGPDSGFVAVTSGSNTVSFVSRGKRVTVKGFAATRSYNLATGLGTIDAARFVPALVAAARGPRGASVRPAARAAPRRSRAWPSNG